MKETALTSVHRSLGATLAAFAGFEMPLWYRDISTEHRAVRRRVGVFDLCHMGRVRFRGPQAVALAQRVQTSDAEGLEVGRTRYGLVLGEDAGIRDDILISRETDGFLLVVNASNLEADLTFFREEARGLEAEVVDDTEREAMVAVQGPHSPAVMESLGFPDAGDLRYYRFATWESEFGRALVSRTGYTGEVGFEVFVPRERAADLFRAALERGEARGAVPCGLGARDTLRLEAGMPLHGHEIHEGVNPLEAALAFAVRTGGGFVGAESLSAIRREGPRRSLVGLVVEGPRIPRQGYPVLEGEREVGRICSGTSSPSLGINIATALLEAPVALNDAELQVSMRKSRVPARRVPLPFYRRKE